MNYSEALEKVLDFVERYNKKDEEKDIAEAALILEKLVKKPQPNDDGHDSWCKVFNDIYEPCDCQKVQREKFNSIK